MRRLKLLLAIAALVTLAPAAVSARGHVRRAASHFHHARSHPGRPHAHHSGGVGGQRSHGGSGRRARVLA